MQRRLRATPGQFDHRQLAALERAVRNPDAVYSAESHARSHNVTEQSARNDFTDLENRGLFARARVGRRYEWFPVAGMAERL